MTITWHRDGGLVPTVQLRREGPFPSPADIKVFSGYGADDADIRRGYKALDDDANPRDESHEFGFLTRSLLPLER